MAARMAQSDLRLRQLLSSHVELLNDLVGTEHVGWQPGGWLGGSGLHHVEGDAGPLTERVGPSRQGPPCMGEPGSSQSSASFVGWCLCAVLMRRMVW